MGFLNRKKTFTEANVASLEGLRPYVNGEKDRFEARLRVVLDDGQRLDLVMDVPQLVKLAAQAVTIAQTYGVDIIDRTSERAVKFWGMGF